MTGAFAAIVIIATVFGSLSVLAAMIGGVVAVLSGRITIPGTHAHRVMAAKAATEWLFQQEEQEKIRARIDGLINMRIHAQLPSAEEREVA